MASPTSDPHQVDIEHVGELQNHWWWRPGWRTGRHFYACHITMDDQPEVHRLAATYQAAIKDMPGLDMIPTQWLHLTMQGIDFVDQVDDDELARVTEAIRSEVSRLEAPVVTFHRPVVRPEAVFLPALPAEPIQELQLAVRRAIADALGPERVTEHLEHKQGYRPHVSIAYANTTQPANPIVEKLRRVRAEPTTATIRRASILEFHRDQRMYEWANIRRLQLG